MLQIIPYMIVRTTEYISMLLAMTQTEFDEAVLGIASHEARIGYACCQLRRQNAVLVASK